MQIISTNVDARLLDTVKYLKGSTTPSYAVHFHTSSLSEMYRSEFQQRIAVNILNDIFRKENGEIFICRDGDIIIIYHGINRVLLSQAVFQLRYLFADDRIANHDDGTENENFSTTYDLAFQWRPFYRVCNERATIAAQHETEVPLVVEQVDKTLLTPTRLAGLLTELEGVDLSYALRRQPVCAIPKSRQVKSVFHEIYVNIAHLRKLLGTDCQLASDRWLFRYLTDMLDVHVMEYLREAPRQYLLQPVSINLNVETLLSQEFRDFCDRVKQEVKTALVIEVNVADVFMDTHAFLSAREIVKAQGYQLCMDGLTNESLQQINREALGFDLAKLQWNADMAGDLGSMENLALARAVERCGAKRLILCRCDSEHAIDYGHGLGIMLFQGRYPDRVVNPNSMIIN